MNYKVVWTLDKSLSKALKNITKDVQDHCFGGWKPQGGISITLNKDCYYVCQAMIK